ncbi:hypothetical protein NEUTE1DRAFT_140505 [Neurospora tetrasperma FGSC 2508]|uniref:Uncharacterized protein n=1 Tax=Neurospora tetrasperma (strain FGSC 2508 / ATCC MYA-4615 / P0657) TaxID=510951 RepID=F8MWQ0_NEUT8|nr:uncharacterized protein NEUTE1DRAFT_140505 [Neurospora tetrasperma FGSC 2508]EGO54171.1 hypothetical protein NEUTE1DRAFT_140505 [Neurospora tetrasperma FGSC 2508]EGZ68400.1 hypothetical protein NEUTE2DRAFT_73120 [Neurospora tetrasperma FGSC 2509]
MASPDSQNINTFLTIEEMNSPKHRAILEFASKKAGFTCYDTFTAWLASPALAPFWTEFERDFLKPLAASRKSTTSFSSPPPTTTTTTTITINNNPPPADPFAKTSTIPCPIYHIIPLFQGMFGTREYLRKGPSKATWRPNHHILYFFLNVWERNHDQMRNSPWAGCYLENVKMWAMQLCWILDAMTRCKYQEELGLHVVEFRGMRDEGCIITYKH